MIYITGDCHREYRRFNTQNFPEQKVEKIVNYTQFTDRIRLTIEMFQIQCRE